MIQTLNEILETILRLMHNLAGIYSQCHEKSITCKIAVHYLTKACSVH